MTMLYRLMPALILGWLCVAWLAPTSAQEGAPAPVPVGERPLIDINAKDLRDLGLGVLIFIVWFVDQRRQKSLEAIIKDYDGALKRYDETQQAHLAAFKDINERNMGAFTVAMDGMQRVAEDARGTAVSCMQFNTRVAERLEIVARHLEGKS